MKLPGAAGAAGEIRLEQRAGGLMAACFTAMGSPCEILVDSRSEALARELGLLAAMEAWRIERKFSRYRDDSVLAAMHRGAGAETLLDAETATLMDFAAQCYGLSEGLFDVTSGVLRRAWKFDGSDRLPAPAAVEALLPLVGFGKLRWDSPRLMLPAGMEIDLGGIGKEYAVDRAYGILAAHAPVPLLVNFGGDLRADRARHAGAWQIGVERPESDRAAAMILELERGALATSGDARRYLLRDGIRYGHILDPRTGWPVVGAPRSVTVAASSCTEAGQLSTLAMLQGAGAREFLEAQEVRYWVVD